MFMISPLSLLSTAGGFSRSGFNNLDNYAGVYGAFESDKGLERFVGAETLANQRGGFGSFLTGFAEGAFLKETVSRVGDGGRMSELGQVLGTTLSSFIPLLAGLFSPPVAAALLMTHNASSLTSGVKSIADGLINGSPTEFANGFFYLIDGWTGGKAAFLKTAMAGNLKGYHQANSEVASLDNGIKASLTAHAEKMNVDAKILLSEVAEQGAKHKDWNVLRTLSIEPKAKLSQVFENSQHEARVKQALKGYVDEKNKLGLLKRNKKKHEHLDAEVLYTGLRQQGEKHPLWRNISGLEVKMPVITLEQALSQRGAALASRQQHLVAVRDESKRIFGNYVENSGAIWQKSTGWLGARFNAGRQSVAGATVNAAS